MRNIKQEVAKAIYDASKWSTTNPMSSWDGLSYKAKEIYGGMAVAAIEAMREIDHTNQAVSGKCQDRKRTASGICPTGKSAVLH